MRKGEEDQGARLIRIIANILMGGAAALAVCLVFLFLCSVGISGGWLPEGAMYQLTISGCAVGGFAGGCLTAVRCGARTLLAGLGAGAVLFLLLLTAGVLIYGDLAVEERGLGLLFACLLGGALAGMLCSRPKKKRRRK